MVPIEAAGPAGGRWNFQYSLCRVVLMVLYPRHSPSSSGAIFQYSLCRVVLMVHIAMCNRCQHGFKLSVLALSSRFDGPCCAVSLAHGSVVFQYSLCRVVLMVPLLDS